MRRKKRILAMLMTVCLTAGMLPQMVFATGTGSACEHHAAHNADCGYAEAQEGSACTHAHGADCYTKTVACLHSHDASCGYSEAQGDSSCAHSCSEDSGCIVSVENCPHGHDSACGYAEAVAGNACAYTCHECTSEAPEDTAQENETQQEESPQEILQGGCRKLN